MSLKFLSIIEFRDFTPLEHLDSKLLFEIAYFRLDMGMPPNNKRNSTYHVPKSAKIKAAIIPLIRVYRD